MNLQGEWIGFYPGHWDEVVKIEQAGSRVVATKITGDDYVPPGEVTWQADLDTGDGLGQIAGLGFTEPRYVPGRLKIIDEERIEFTWEGVGSVHYRRDD